MRRSLLCLSLALLLGTAALATAAPLTRGGEPAVHLSASAEADTGSLLSAFVHWLFGLWDASSNPQPGPPPGPPPAGPNGDNGSCLDPDGQPCVNG